MLGFSRKLVISLLLITLIGYSLLVACGGDSNNGGNGGSPTPPLPNGIETPPLTEITIGNLSDYTGVSSNAMEYINMALDDLVEYYNENNLIPGVRLKVITYDGQMDPSRDIPGYEWLKQKGADLIFTPIPATPTTLKPRADRDEVVVFGLSGSKKGFLPPGWVFDLGIYSQYEAYTLLKWIAENDWDYQTKGPAKIGGAAWSESYSDELFTAMKEYCSVHPDQFEWEGGYLTNFSLIWAAEVDALKDCDYVNPGIVLTSFVKEYRAAGHTEAKFIGSDTQAAFLGMMDASELWDEIDGMLFLKTPRWWHEEGEIIDLVMQLLYENHPDDAEKIIRSGNGYLAMNQMYPMFQIIADAAEAVGPQNLDSQALYDAATSLLLMIDGTQRFSFSEEKRDAIDAFAIYEARATEKDIFRLHDEWYPTVRNP